MEVQTCATNDSFVTAAHGILCKWWANNDCGPKTIKVFCRNAFKFRYSDKVIFKLGRLRNLCYKTIVFEKNIVLERFSREFQSHPV